MSEIVEGPLQAYFDAGRHAYEEHGMVLVTVFCKAHGGAKLGDVRASSAGPVFRSVERGVIPRDRFVQDKIALRAAGVPQRSVPEPSANLTDLLEHPDAPEDVPAWCPEAGRGGLDRQALIAQARIAMSGLPAKHSVACVRLTRSTPFG